MDVELLVVSDCPDEESTALLLRSALDDVGLGWVEFTTTTVAAVADAERHRFTDSPTILIDGVDPFAGSGRPGSVACRLYPSGSPDLGTLRQALKRAAVDGVSR